MPISFRTKVTLAYIAAALFGLAGVVALLAALEDHKRTHIAQTVIWFTICIVLLANARNKGKRTDPSKETHPTNPNERSA